MRTLKIYARGWWLLCWVFALGGLMAVGCGGDYRYYRCEGAEECGKDSTGRVLSCACDKVCRATCKEDKDCIEGESCVTGFCVHSKETESKLGVSCTVDGQPESCQLGKTVCSSGGILTCRAEQKPKQEVCNGKDDDCNGLIDDGLSESCTNECGSGLKLCVEGKWQECNAINSRPCQSQIGECEKGIEYCREGKWQGACEGATQPSAEECDEKDNDCDGKIDEDFSNKGKACTVGKGECERVGTWRCRDDKSGLQCSALPGVSQEEICDGKDNDCDGAVDESLERACRNVCGPGKQICVNGSWTSCDAVSARFCGQEKGECRQGIELCKADKWSGLCDLSQGGKSEICDDKDNDCDGQIDESWPEKGKVCQVGKGDCESYGVWLCRKDEGGIECSAKPRPPTQEVCDGKDNDCNGLIDEKLSRGCTDVCGTGKQVCNGGQWAACDAVGSRVCGTQVGICLPGTEICKEGGWQGVCKGVVSAKIELCNGKDDDCDGEIDELWPTLTSDCFSQGIGECRLPGKVICNATGLGVECTSKVPGTPKLEVCDGKDNDCDGEIDNVPPTLLSGHTAGLTGMAFDNTGSFVATSSLDRTVRIWSLQGLKTTFLRALTFTSVPNKLLFTPGGLLVVGLGDGTIQLISPSTGMVSSTLRSHTGAVTALSLGQFGKVMASGGADQSVKIWELSTGRLIRTLNNGQGTVNGLSFGLFGKVVGVGAAGSTNQLWNLTQATSLTYLKTLPVLSFVFSPGGQNFYAGLGDGKVRHFSGIVVDIFDFHFSSTIPGSTYTIHKGAVNSMLIEPSGRFLISGSADKTLKVTSLSHGGNLLTLGGHTGSVTEVTLNPQFANYKDYVLGTASADKTAKLWSCIKFP